MDKIILSLKNIYKLLMANDFPVYSESVIGEKERKGQTVIRFWQHILTPEFKSLPCGKLLWRYTEKRNRYTSQLCNRSLPSNLYQKYVREIVSQLSETTLFNQIDLFSQFLSGRLYQHEVLIRRIREFVRMCRTEDPYMTETVAAHLSQCVEGAEKSRSPRLGLFQASYLLTLLTIYAAASEAMGEPVLEELRQERFGMDALWSQRKRRRTEAPGKPVFLTVRAGLLQDNPLPYNRYFGREEALYDLQEAILNQQKCLISGVGGIGKTELLRQLIRRCVQGNLVNALAAVPYRGSLLESFACAFPEFQEKEPEESFHGILHQLRKRAEQGEKLLLAIDDLRGDPEQDPHFAQLRDLPCCILITSRRESLEGFEAYRLADPSVTAGALIFRDHYGKPLPPEDRALLKELLQKELICHPLTLKMMARAARSRNWEMSQLQARLLEAGCSLTWTEGDRTVRLSQIYHQLYSISEIPEKYKPVVELFTLLPMESYSPEFLETAFPEALGSMETLTAALRRLAAGGWLEKSKDGFFMHPLIAQCLRRKTVTEGSIRPFLRGIRSLLPEFYIEDGWNDQADSRELQKIYRIMRSFAGSVSGPVSRELFRDWCVSMHSVAPTKLERDQNLALLDDMKKRCANMDEELEVLYVTVYAFFDCVDGKMTAEIAEIYEKQKEHLTVSPELFYKFCCHAGHNLAQENPELAREILVRVLEGEASASLKATTYYHLTYLYISQEKLSEALEWGEQGLAFVRAHPECGKLLTIYNMVSPCNIYLVFGRMDEAEELLRQMGELIGEDSLPSQRAEYTQLCGICAMNQGRLEEALSECRKSVELVLEYYGKTDIYYVELSQTGTILIYLKRYPETVEIYEEVLAYAKAQQNGPMIAKMSNNLAVCYLEMEQPQEALRLLEEVTAQARQTGGVLLGEVLRNKARAYRMLEDPGQELVCLRESLPLLEASYGPDHPRSAAARERLAELDVPSAEDAG